MENRTPQDKRLAQACAQYFTSCAEQDRPPDIEGLCEHLQLTREEFFACAHAVKTPGGRTLAMALVRIANHKRRMLYDGKLSVNTFMFDFKNNHQYDGKTPRPAQPAQPAYDFDKLTSKELFTLKRLLRKASAHSDGGEAQ